MEPTKTERAFALLVKLVYMIDAGIDVKRRFEYVKRIFINSGTILP